MKCRALSIGLSLIFGAMCAVLVWSAQAQAATSTFTTPGTYTYTVPTGVTKIQALVRGGGGGGGGADAVAGGVGGNGGLQTIVIAVTPGQTVSGGVADHGYAGFSSGASLSNACSGYGLGGWGQGAGSIGGQANCPNAAGYSGGGGGGAGSSSVIIGGVVLAQAGGGGGGGGGVSTAGNSAGGNAIAPTTQTSCATASASTIGASANGDGGGGGGGGGGYIGGIGGAAALDSSGIAPAGGGGGTSCISSNAVILSSSYAVVPATGGAAATAGSNGAVTITTYPTLTLTMVSVGNVGPFTFSGNNGWASQTITTVTSGTSVAGAVQTLAAYSTATTITEAIPAGYVMSAATCSGMGTGGTATPNFAAGTVTLDAAATAPGSVIACSITDTKTPVFRLQVNTGLGFGGPFSFAQTNLAATPGNITTTAANTPTPASPTATNISAIGTAVTVTGTPPTGFDLYAVSCSDANSAITGKTGTFGTFATNALTVPVANVVAGADITCVLSSHRFPKLTLSKVTTGLTGSFTFTGTNGWTSQSITTATAGTAVQGTSQFLTAISTATSITEANNPAFVLQSASCTDQNSANTGKTGSFGTLSGTVLTIPTANIIYGADILCAFSNQAANPTLQITKTADKPGPVKVGDVITYTYTVKNTGYVAISNVSVSDSHNGKGTKPVIGSKALLTDAAPTGDTTDTHPAAGGLWDSLGPGDTITFKSTYTVTQQDIDLLQ